MTQRKYNLLHKEKPTRPLTKPTICKPCLMRCLATIALLILTFFIFTGTGQSAASTLGKKTTQSPSGIPIIDLAQFLTIDRKDAATWTEGRIVAVYKHCSQRDSSFSSWKMKVPLGESCEAQMPTTNYWMMIDVGMGGLVLFSAPYVIPLNYTVSITLGPSGVIELRDVKIPKR